MSSAVGRLKKVKKSPLPCSGVPFRDDESISTNSKGSPPPSHDLLSTMSRRLASVEKELQKTRKELANKEMYIHRLEERLACVDDRGLLEERCRALQQQVNEMEEFLGDYGMVWVGGDKPKTHTNIEVNFDLIIKHIKELNGLCNHTAITSTATGATFKSMDVIPLTLYKNGLVLFQGPFRPYSHPATQQLCADLADGYFPSELQSSYPDGVPFECVDQRHANYSQEIGVMSGGRRESVDSFLSKLPVSVMRGGKVIDIRASVAHTLKGEDKVSTVTEEPLTPSHTTTLRVHSTDKTYVLKMLPTDTIASVRQHINKLRCVGGSRYQLKSSFPPRTFDDPTHTLSELGLTPTANIFIS